MKPLRIILAPDSFKGSLTAPEAAEAMAQGVRQALPSAEVVLLPLADGGEGTAEALCCALGGRRLTARCVDPIGRPIDALYGIADIADDADATGTADAAAAKPVRTALLDMASVCGLTLLTATERDVMRSSTLGVGQLMADAWRQGAERIILGIGGSATCDGGMGLLAALGVRFFDRAGGELLPSGEAMTRVARIDASAIQRGGAVTVMCDVDNPLYGPDGAACVFAPQKGASPEEVARLDSGLRSYARAIGEATGVDICKLPGGGAAGGVGAALAAFLGAELRSGIATLLGLTRFDALVGKASLVITGEGRIDSQTLRGKVPCGVMRAAAQRGVPTVALGGSVADEAELLKAGFRAVAPITPEQMTLEEAMKPAVASRNLRNTTAQLLSSLLYS